MRATAGLTVPVRAAVLALTVASVSHAADGGADASAPDGGSADGGAPALHVIAAYCSDTDLECTIAPLSYGKTITLPIAFDFDTGWQPPNSDLQVDFFLKLPASTTVELTGYLQTTWPEAMTLSTPAGSHGLLSFDYGLLLGAQARLDVNVLGIPVKWQGDVPFVPKVNFEMKGQKQFTPWAFDPGVSASASSAVQKLFEVNLLSLAGIPSQISKGGVALDIKGDLTATYVTDRIRIEASEPGDLPILAEDGTTTRKFVGGGFVEYDVWPEGHVDYLGTLHLIPTFFIEVLGQSFDLPVVDLPVPIDIGTQDFVFDPIRVHVPLPDFLTPPENLDFGPVSIGKSKQLAIDLSNVGEAKARATGFLDTNGSTAFALPTAEVTVASLGQSNYAVSFAPKQAGKLQSTLTLVTNDPDQRFITVKLLGSGVDGEVARPDGGSDQNAANGSEENGGCGCRLAERQRHGGSALALLALGLLALRRIQDRPA